MGTHELRSPEQMELVRVMHEARRPMFGREISEALGYDARYLLRHMTYIGAVRKCGKVEKSYMYVLK